VFAEIKESRQLFCQSGHSIFIQCSGCDFLTNLGMRSGRAGYLDSPCTLLQTALTPRFLAFRIAVKYESVRAADEGAF
jgi:hypothetical protein